MNKYYYIYYHYQYHDTLKYSEGNSFSKQTKKYYLLCITLYRSLSNQIIRGRDGSHIRARRLQKAIFSSVPWLYIQNEKKKNKLLNLLSINSDFFLGQDQTIGKFKRWKNENDWFHYVEFCYRKFYWRWKYGRNKYIRWNIPLFLDLSSSSGLFLFPSSNYLPFAALKSNLTTQSK